MKRYFCLLDGCTTKTRNAITDDLRNNGTRVPFEYSQGFEAVTTPEKAEELFVSKEIIAYTKRQFSAETLDKLNAEPDYYKQGRLAEQWNMSITAKYQRKRKILPDEGLAKRAWHTILDVEKLQVGIEAIVKEKEEKLGNPNPIIDLKNRKFRELESKELKRVLKSLEEIIKDETVSSHLIGALAIVKSKYLHYLLDLDWLLELLDLIRLLIEEAPCWEMRGKQSVGLVIIESSRANGPKFDNTERDEIIDEIREGLAHLENEFPGNDLAWVIDEQRVLIDIANQADSNDSSVSDDEYFLLPGIAAVDFNGNTYPASFDGLAQYREDLRLDSQADHSFVIFITPYGASWHGYSASTKFFILLAKHPSTGVFSSDWGGWGQGHLSDTTIHEVIHRYNGAHEYGEDDTGSQPCSACGGEFGCDKIPNGNCVDCNESPHDCAMRGGSDKICPWTRGHIGWSDLFVELETSDVTWAGTNDGVFLDIGDETFNLDHAWFDDRERGQKDGYAIWAGGSLERNMIRRILIHKEDDGIGGGWKLKRCKVWHKGEIICDESPAEWLHDNKTFWLGCTFDDDYINSLKVIVTTADVLWAGTDDNVSITMGGRTWNLDNSGVNDFERGDTNTFYLYPGTSIQLSDIRTIRINKSRDGIAGGWKLGGLRVIVNGNNIYNNPSINRWLQDDSRTFTDNV